MSLLSTTRLERAIITGLLITETPLHVGSGYDGAAPDRQGGYATLCLDIDGQPYIPASTLRGQLCRLLARDAARHRRLCGTARLPHDPTRTALDQDPGNAGALRIYDACWAGALRAGPELERRVSLDAITHTASDHLLFAEDLVPADSAFRWRLELDQIDVADLDAVLAGLRRLRHEDGVGAGRSRMQGRLRWDTGAERVLTLAEDELVPWLVDDDLLPPPYKPYVPTLSDPERSEGTRLDPITGELYVELAVEPSAPLLVSPHRPKQSAPSATDADGLPDLVFRRRGNEAILSATSLKGIVRAQARRILLTRLAADAPALTETGQAAIADRIVACIFGGVVDGQHRKATLHIGAATGAFVDADQAHRFFNAIDRFTGGVADARLFDVLAVMPESFRWELALKPPLLGDSAALGLLVYLLRDAVEGDLSIGWGRARGLAAIRIYPRLPGESRPESRSHAGPVSWQECLDCLDAGNTGLTADEVADWLDALDCELRRHIAAVTRGAEDETAAGPMSEPELAEASQTDASPPPHPPASAGETA
jgi:CRISPR/Cas system CSM-associated protein Csm3 (group 7 of RAMP superfamily)